MPVDACSHPLALRLTRVHGLTGELTTGTVERRCGTPVLERCPSCAEIYRRDAMRVLFEGVAANPGPRTWITLTAPGDAVFGRTHTAAYTRKASQRCACREFHSPNDPRVGEPLDPAAFRYDLVADFNRAAGRLVAVTMQKLRRLTGSDEPLPYARVVEYQRRGLVHVHVLVAAAIPRSVVELAVRGGVN